jgi:hypothetical protein
MTLLSKNLFRTIFLNLFLILGTFTHIQGQIEIVVATGSSHFLGDLGGKPWLGTNDISDLDLPSTRVGLMLGVRAFVHKKVAFRAAFIGAQVAGDDKHTTNLERNTRNLNFYSPIAEGSFVLEYHFNRSTSRFGPPKGGLYAYGGIAAFYFEPKTEYNGQTYNLRELGTEGQFYRAGMQPYKNTSYAVPFGVGYRFNVGRGYLGLEINSRKTFTDYIDDVSTTFADVNAVANAKGGAAGALADRSLPTSIVGFSEPGAIRGDPKNNDNYFFIFVKFDYPLGMGGDVLSFGKSRGRRPSGKFKKGKCFEF